MMKPAPQFFQPRIPYYPADTVLNRQLQNYIVNFDRGEFDNERLIGDLAFNTSNSYAGVDFQITAYIPVDHEEQEYLQRYFQYEIDRATSEGNSRLASNLRRRQTVLQRDAYIEDLTEITDLSISSRRSEPSVRRFGESSPTSTAKGVRTFGGSMVMALLKKDPLLELYQHDLGDMLDNSPFFVDRIPPFHIVMTATNEYGHTISAGIFGITIVDFAGVISVNDMYSELQYSYKARYMTPFVHHDVRAKLKDYVDMVGARYMGTSASTLADNVMAATKTPKYRSPRSAGAPYGGFK